MSQSSVILPGSPLSGSTMVGDINAAWASIISCFSGTVAPTLGPGGSGALVAGQLWLNTSVAPYQLSMYDGTTWCEVGTLDFAGHTFTAFNGPQDFRNIIGDNGGFEVWQRGAGSAASIAVGASSTAYTADRWYLTTGANQASIVSAVTGLTSGSGLAGKVIRNSGQTGTTAMVFGYPLDTDELARMRGNKVTISGTVKAGANWSPSSGTITMTLYVGTGAVGKRGGGFTGETNVVTQTGTVTVSTQQAFAFSTSAAVVPASSTQGELQFAWTPVGTAGADDSMTFDDIQLEVAQFASVFERIPFEKMLLGCQRHFYKSFLYGTAPVQNAGANTGEIQAIIGKDSTAVLAAIIPVRFPIVMRTTPSITTYNPQAGNNIPVRQTGTGAPTTIGSVATTNVTSNSITVTGSGDATTNGRIGDQVAIHVAADAGI